MTSGVPPCLLTHIDLDPLLSDLGTRLTWTGHSSCQLFSEESKCGEGAWGDGRTDKHPLNRLQASHTSSWQHQIWGLGIEKHNLLIK